MRTAMVFFFSLVLLTSCFGQSTSTKWQVATILDIKAHRPSTQQEAPALQYYVTVKVDRTEYVVLYVAPDTSLQHIIEYHPGMDGLVLVGADTIKYNDMLGRTHEVPIISRHAISAKSPGKKPGTNE